MQHVVPKKQRMVPVGFGVLHVLRGVGESRAVLRGRVLWTVWGHVAQHHHHRPVGIHLLGHAEVVDAVVGNDVRQVVLQGGHMHVLTIVEFMVQTCIKLLQQLFFSCALIYKYI